jgi:hypothetical protein
MPSNTASTGSSLARPARLARETTAAGSVEGRDRSDVVRLGACNAPGCLVPRAFCGLEALAERARGSRRALAGFHC